MCVLAEVLILIHKTVLQLRLRQVVIPPMEKHLLHHQVLKREHGFVMLQGMAMDHIPPLVHVMGELVLVPPLRLMPALLLVGQLSLIVLDQLLVHIVLLEQLVAQVLVLLQT